MNTLKKYGMLTIKFLITFIIGIFILSIFYYLLFNSKVTYIIGIIYFSIIYIIFSFKEAKKSNNKGIVVGTKTGLFLIFITILFNIIFYKTSFKLTRLIYYLILLLSSILGAIIGVNTKKE
jgi:putative membrane protein (TIGR04086 family)